MASLTNEYGKNKILGMLLGAPGAGKSSLINSLTQLCKFDEDYPTRKYPYVPTAKTKMMGGHTMMREPVVLTDTLTIVDNRGWHDWGNTAALRELTAQIHGKRTFDEDVNWTDTGDTSAAAKGQRIARVVSDKIDCIAIVINGLGGVESIENIGMLIDTCNNIIRRYPSIVITHKDKMSPKKIESIKSLLESKYMVDSEKIFVIKNVTTRRDILDDESKSILSRLVEELVSDGLSGSAAHGRTEKQLIKNREMEEKNHEMQMRKAEKELENKKQENARIQMNTDRKRLAELSQMELKQKDSEVSHTIDVNALEKEMLKTLNALKITQAEDWHEHQKQLQERRYKDLSEK